MTTTMLEQRGSSLLVNRRRPRFANPKDGFHVASFILPDRTDNWRISEFRVTDADAQLDRLKAQLSTERGGRWTPPGRYVKLSRLLAPGVDDLWTPEHPRWLPVMSDVPDEYRDHLDLFQHATGRVLIHGLGLGCALSAVLTLPHVEHVDVVEVNAEVIALVGPYYRDDPRVTIYHDSCVTKKWPAATRWKYVWHDIWSFISADNLSDDADAEHGISYATLHRKFGGRCDRQGSWAFGPARWMRATERRFEHRCASFVFAWNQLWTPRERFEELLKASAGAIPVNEWRRLVVEQNARMARDYRRVCQRPITLGDARLMLDR